MIRVNRIIPQTVPLYSPSGEWLGDVNEYELNDIRLQICSERAIGYYVMYEGEKISINKYGVIESWKKGLFDLLETQAGKLLTMAFNERKRHPHQP